MPFQITGTIELIGATTPISSKREGGQTYYKRELVLDCTRYNPETGEPWENHPKFELSGQKCNLLDNFQPGQRVTVDFSLNGSKYPDQQTGEIKYFTTVKAFKIELAQQQHVYQQPTAPTYQQPTAPQQPFPPPTNANGEPVNDPDDLPF